MKALDEQRAAKRKAREEAEQAYLEELARMLAKTKAMNGLESAGCGGAVRVSSQERRCMA